MNLPPIVYSLRFWESVALIIAVAVAGGGLAEPEQVAVILGVILAVLRLIGVQPELRAKGRIK